MDNRKEKIENAKGTGAQWGRRGVTETPHLKKRIRGSAVKNSGDKGGQGERGNGCQALKIKQRQIIPNQQKKKRRKRGLRVNKERKEKNRDSRNKKVKKTVTRRKGKGRGASRWREKEDGKRKQQ